MRRPQHYTPSVETPAKLVVHGFRCGCGAREASTTDCPRGLFSFSLTKCPTECTHSSGQELLVCTIRMRLPMFESAYSDHGRDPPRLLHRDIRDVQRQLRSTEILAAESFLAQHIWTGTVGTRSEALTLHKRLTCTHLLFLRCKRYCLHTSSSMCVPLTRRSPQLLGFKSCVSQLMLVTNSLAEA